MYFPLVLFSRKASGLGDLGFVLFCWFLFIYLVDLFWFCCFFVSLLLFFFYYKDKQTPETSKL